MGAALTVTGVVLVAAQARPQAHLRHMALLAAITAMLTAALLLSPGRRPAPARLVQRLMGGAALVWGVGHAMAAPALDQSTTWRATGDLVAISAAPLAAASLLALARGRTRTVELARLALDALLLGSAAALLVWRLFFRFDGAAAGPTMLVCTVLVIDCALIAMLLLLYLRDLDHGTLLTLAGAALYVAGDAVYLHVVLQPGPHWPWQAAALWVLSWPTIGVGLLQFRPPRGAVRDAGDRKTQQTEARTTAGVTAGSLVLLIGTITAVLEGGSTDSATSWLGLLVVAVLAAREVVGGLQRQSMLRELTELAYHDQLTRLGNRRALTERLDAETGHSPASVLTLDLDGFKEVNDVLGHGRGDELLAAVAGNLSRALPADCEAFRIGGDEFAVVVPGPVERAQSVAEDLLVAVRAAAADVPGAGASVSASVGVATLVSDHTPLIGPDVGAQVPGTDIPTALMGSGVALHAAKAAGRDRVESYDGPVAAAHRRGLLVERRLRTAIDAGSVVPHYQPIVSLSTRLVVGVEALARWDDDVLGPVPPDEFIPVAERSSQIVALGASVLRQSICDLASPTSASLMPADGSALRLGVNVSVVQLRRPGFADAVLDELHEYGFGASCLIVEVTESLFVDVDDPAVRELRTLRAAGVHVAIDDFGSGYSSLAYLTRMPADILKIDRGLTGQVLYDDRLRVVLQTIVNLAKTLPMDVVVEGVESAAVHDLVRDLGGEFGQGWLYGAAVPYPKLAATIADINARALTASPIPHQGR